MTKTTRELVDELGSSAGTLRNLLSTLEGVPPISGNPPQQLRTALEKANEILRLINDLDRRLPDIDVADAAAIKDQSIAAFFNEVGKGVVAAQSSLDEKSLAYMAKAQGFPPTMFRLPRANAEIKFALEYEKEKGFNFFIAKRTDTERESMQHRVSFDIVSAPLPPDTLAEMQARAATFPYVGNPLEREGVRLRLQAYADNADAPAPKAREARKLADDRDRFDATIILSVGDDWALVEPSIIENDAVTVRTSYLAKNGTEFVPGEAKRPAAASLADLFRHLAAFAVEQRQRLQAGL